MAIKTHATRSGFVFLACVGCTVLVLCCILTIRSKHDSKTSASLSGKYEKTDLSNTELFHDVYLNSIKPAGWLKNTLITQAEGLTGHLDEVVGYPFNTDCWEGKPVKHEKGEKWWPYEQTAYWIDGMIKCGFLIDDHNLIQKAKQPISCVYNKPDRDGYLGPALLKKDKHNYKWPNTVFFRALIAYYSENPDPLIPERLRKHYLSDKSKYHLLRNVTNVEIMLWTYEKTGDKRLLDMAENCYLAFCKKSSSSSATIEAMTSDEIAKGHGVTFNETAKLAALLYYYTGKKEYLKAAVNAYDKVAAWQTLASGVCSSSESLRGNDPLDSHETCDIADMTWSLGYLLLATGKTKYADWIEKACFNAAMGASTPDFRAIQYFSCANQVICTSDSNHNFYSRGHSQMSYRPEPGLACCEANYCRILPNYVSRMWLQDQQSNPVAALYGPSQHTFTHSGSNTKVTIVEETDYPFSDNITFRFKVTQPVRFTFRFRVPSWCKRCRVLLNNVNQQISDNGGGFTGITREFHNNDFMKIELQSEIIIQKWPRNGVSCERGPLVFSLPVKTKMLRDQSVMKSNADFPAWNIYPAGEWNYGLHLNKNCTPESARIIKKRINGNPWTPENAPIKIQLNTAEINNWQLRKATTADMRNHLFTPQLPDSVIMSNTNNKTVQTTTLVPYGCTRLRITVFPVIHN